MTYQDVNVTSALKAGQQVRVCNEGWSSFVELDKVAVINGSILAQAPMQEAQAMGLLQVLRAVDSSITASWALQYMRCDFPFSGIVIETPNRNKLRWRVGCSYNAVSPSTKDVIIVLLSEASSGAALPVAEGLQRFPAMNTELIVALLSFQQLTYLQLDIGRGSVLPQLAALEKLENIFIIHYCLRGALPTNVMASLRSLQQLEVVPKPRAVGASDPAGGVCGLSGSLTHHTRPDTLSPLKYLDVHDNQITGQLPPQLLSMAVEINLSNNKISGSIPGLTASSRIAAEKVKLDRNRLEGLFPRSWRRAANKTLHLDLHDNPGLSDCVPLSTGIPEQFVMDAANTAIRGTCRTKAAAIAQEQSQWQALRTLLPKVLVGTGAYAVAFENMVQTFLEAMSRLGQLIGDGDTLSQVTTSYQEHYLEAVLVVIDGVEYVMRLEFFTFDFIDIVPLHPAVHLAPLVKLMKALPYADLFRCEACDGNPVPGDVQLLAGLAATSIQILQLPGCGLNGRLPLQWSAWQSLKVIDLADNNLTGVLPPSWATLGELSTLTLSNNNLQGSLPDNWGQGNVMVKSLLLDVSNNTRMTGNIPASWSYFGTGFVQITGTQVGGCVPDGLLVDKPLLPCSSVSREAAALAQLKSLLEGAGISAGPGLFTWITGTNYCGGFWVGVTCEGPNTVTGLNLTALSVKIQEPATLQVLDVVAAISNLTQLQTLVLAGIGLSGPVQDPSRHGLHSFTKLRHLDISGNPALSGDLPSSWFAMRGLTTLDISATGIGGTLPEDFAAFQELRVFRAVACSGITGRLPPAWGLLKLEVLELTNAALTGGLPPEWADAAALQKAAATLAASMEAQTATAASAAADPAASRAADTGHNRTEDVAAQPAALGMQRLRALDLSVAAPGRGGLSGALPAAFAQLEQLQVLVLSGHNFNGSLPPAWTRLSQLRVLDVSRNILTGSLPKWYASMLQLAVLKVHDNQLLPAANGVPEIFEYLVGDGLKLQCLCVANNSGVLLGTAKAAELKRKAQASSPPAQLVVDEPTDRLCDAQAWK